MASRTQQSVIKRFGPAVRTIGGTFFPQGASVTPLTRANGFLKSDGGIANVTRTGTAGTYLVTLEDSYRAVLDHLASVRLATPADIVAQFGVFSNLGTPTRCAFLIVLLTGATPTDVAANADNAVSFVISFTDAITRST